MKNKTEKKKTNNKELKTFRIIETITNTYTTEAIDGVEAEANVKDWKCNRESSDTQIDTEEVE